MLRARAVAASGRAHLVSTYDHLADQRWCGASELLESGYKRDPGSAIGSNLRRRPSDFDIRRSPNRIAWSYMLMG